MPVPQIQGAKLSVQGPEVHSSRPAGALLQRKCACGGAAGLTGECETCRETKLQRRPLAVNTPGDRYEQEADRVADAVVSGRGQAATFSLSAVPITRVQREDAPKEKTNEEKFKEAGDKLKDAFLATPLGKDLQEKVKQDKLVKGATEAGKSFIGTLPGKIITGAAAAGAVATLAALHKELPAQVPEIPLDVLTPGLSVQITYKGPVDKPTEAMITFKYSEQAPKGGGDGERKPVPTRAEKQRAENAVVAADQAKFRAGISYPPGSPEDLQQRADEEAAKRALAKYAPGPDLDAMVKKYPWLQAPQPKSGPQLQMPKPSFGYKPPALLGDEYKLKLPGEQKKEEDEPALQRKAAGEATTDTAPPVVHDVLQSAGQPLDAGTRAFMEQRFGHDFGQVRVHTDARAAQSAQAVSANAYTVGHNIVFGVGRFAPETHEGRRLIAHELTHVVQQSSINGSRVRESDRRRGLPSLSTTSEVHVQRGPSDPESPKVDVPILGASKATSEIVVLYHYGDLEAMGERDAKTEMGAPFTSSRSYPRLTDCDTATCQAEVARHTGTPPRETVRHKYELRIDRAYFEKNFSNTGTRGAYSEFASKQSIPIKYFRRVSTIAPASSAPPRLPNKSGEFTAKTPRPTPPTQRGKAVTQSGSYQEVLSGEMVKGEIGGKGVPPTPTGGGGPGLAATAKVNAATGAPLEPVVEATPGFRPERGAGIGGSVQWLNSSLGGSIQDADRAEAVARFEALAPEITRLLKEGNTVTVTIEVEVPTIFQFGVVYDVSQLVHYRYMYIKSTTKPLPPSTGKSGPAMYPVGGEIREGFGDPHRWDTDELTLDQRIRAQDLPGMKGDPDPAKKHQPQHPTHRILTRDQVFTPSILTSPPVVQTQPPPSLTKPKPQLDPAAKKALAAAPARVYVESENVIQYKTAYEVIKALAGSPLFGEVKEDMGGGLGRTRTIISYRSDLDKAKAEALAKIVRSKGVPTASAELSGSGDDDPGVLTIWFGRDAERAVAR